MPDRQAETRAALVEKLEVGLARSCVSADNENYTAVCLTIAETSLLLKLLASPGDPGAEGASTSDLLARLEALERQWLTESSDHARQADAQVSERLASLHQLRAALCLQHAAALRSIASEGREAVAQGAQCVHGHRMKQVGCVSCELLWKHSTLAAPLAPDAREVEQEAYRVIAWLETFAAEPGLHHELPGELPATCEAAAKCIRQLLAARAPQAPQEPRTREIEAQLAEIERHDPGFIDAVKAYYGVPGPEPGQERE